MVGDYNENDIIDACIKDGFLTRFDVKEYTVQAEIINDDEYEMSFWGDCSEFIG